MEARNGMIFKIQQELAELQKTCSRLGRDTVIEKVDRIVPKAYRKFFRISVDDAEKGVSLVWEVNDVARVEAERMDGKYLLYASDPSLSATDVVRIYFEKDYVEKVFRDLKTFEEVAPIRHRRESRVLGVIFVCTLALRLKTALRVMLETEGKKEMSAEELLKKLGRVHRVDLQKDTEREIWYTGLQKTGDLVYGASEKDAGSSGENRDEGHLRNECSRNLVIIGALFRKWVMTICTRTVNTFGRIPHGM